MSYRTFLASATLCALACTSAPAATVSYAARGLDRQVPRYSHVFLVIEENHGDQTIFSAGYAPNLTRLAQTYGSATRFYATTHPSEPNYVALISGSTYGIADDASFMLPSHSLDQPNLATQVQAHGLSWGGYFGGYDPATPLAVRTPAKYASKHNPFVNFTTLRNQPGFANHQHAFGKLAADLRAGTVANFTVIVPGLCEDMHGAKGCDDDPQKVRTGDRIANTIVREIMSSPAWRSRANAAIVITWDENDDAHRGSGVQGCCGALPGGGRIPTIVITNHGPRHVWDATPYNHYSLLRTLEDAFGIHAYLSGAGDWAAGIRPMAPLFAVKAATISATAR